ncbi:MAG TPA: YcgN family cysteine cluster protein, partial [Balneolales bacterium]|nr:YcgN family cysteine cluster protein [Balneolales bacterium]
MYKDTHKKSSFGNIMEQKQDLFWKTKSLKEMTKAEWESLCDNCGRCCLHSVQDGKTGKIKLLSVACQYLDVSTCRCLIYEDRVKIESDCERLSPDKIRRIKKLPYTCAYRSLVEGRQLEWWHPLVSGDPNTVNAAGISVQGKVVTGENVNQDDLVY